MTVTGMEWCDCVGTAVWCACGGLVGNSSRDTHGLAEVTFGGKRDTALAGVVEAEAAAGAVTAEAAAAAGDDFVLTFMPAKSPS